MAAEMNSNEMNTAVDLFRLWSEIPETSRGEFIAQLLNRSKEWHEWAISDNFAIGWLKAKFANADVPWPPNERNGANDR